MTKTNKTMDNPDKLTKTNTRHMATQDEDKQNNGQSR